MKFEFFFCLHKKEVLQMSELGVEKGHRRKATVLCTRFTDI